MEYMDGGSLDLIMKKAGRIPEPMISTITCAVSQTFIININTEEKRKTRSRGWVKFYRDNVYFSN